MTKAKEDSAERRSRRSEETTAGRTLDFHGALFTVTANGNVERAFREGELRRLAPSIEFTAFVEECAAEADDR